MQAHHRYTWKLHVETTSTSHDNIGLATESYNLSGKYRSMYYNCVISSVMVWINVSDTSVFKYWIISTFLSMEKGYLVKELTV